MLTLHLLLRGDEFIHFDGTVERVVIRDSSAVFEISGDRSNIRCVGRKREVVCSSSVDCNGFVLCFFFILRGAFVATAQNGSCDLRDVGVETDDSNNTQLHVLHMFRRGVCEALSRGGSVYRVTSKPTEVCPRKQRVTTVRSGQQMLSHCVCSAASDFGRQSSRDCVWIKCLATHPGGMA